jgi:hypothetical protein
MDQVSGSANISPSRGFYWGIRNRVHYNQNHKIDVAWQEQVQKLKAKPPKPINTLLSFVSQPSPGTLCRPKALVQGRQFNEPCFGFDDLVFPKMKPQGRILLIQRALAKISPGGFVAYNNLSVRFLALRMVQGNKNSLGKRNISKS